MLGPSRPELLPKCIYMRNAVCIVAYKPAHATLSSSRPLPCAAAAATDREAVLQPTSDSAGPEVNFAAPKQCHQPHLTGKERAELRAFAENLAKTKKLQRLQVGGQGLTHNVLGAIMDILQKHEYVRVKLGEGCGLERRETAALLAGILDAAVVGQVGFTITLYRQQGLPRPDNLLK